MSKVEIKVNNNKIPLNQFVNTIVSKLILAIVDSLKGIEDKDIENVNITLDMKLS
ncbi:MAG: hypothetical protein H7645_01805 [Candidatus Heimdallarchaeota archaeon]|nr:hypothetical protein [Candidatus Heimdallarchaeota archaeon]MCK4769052.1 hypothetical protein [Candidatus Heimdallarchaeota archaeon]